MTDSDEVPTDVLSRIRSMCLMLPDAYEQSAWIGTRWRIRMHTFAHVLVVTHGSPAAFARAIGRDGTFLVVTFHSLSPEIDALEEMGYPYFRPRWSPTIAGLVLADDVDWSEVRELIVESYCARAPKKLVALLDRPGD